MKKSTEKKIEKVLGEKAGKNLEKEIQKEVKKDIEKEVKKKLHAVVYERTKSSALRFRNEFRAHAVTAIVAAFAFLIALSWRNPIQKSVEALIKAMGLVGGAIYLEYLSAIIITIIAVLVLMWVSRWKVEGK